VITGSLSGYTSCRSRPGIVHTYEKNIQNTASDRIDIIIINKMLSIFIVLLCVNVLFCVLNHQFCYAVSYIRKDKNSMYIFITSEASK